MLQSRKCCTFPHTFNGANKATVARTDTASIAPAFTQSDIFANGLADPFAQPAAKSSSDLDSDGGADARSNRATDCGVVPESRADNYTIALDSSDAHTNENIWTQRPSVAGAN